MSDYPLIDKRQGTEIVEQAKQLAAVYTSEWKFLDNGAGEPGVALLHLFGRLMEIVIQRLNRVPEKNFLAFLDLAGVAPLPPRAARTPVRFLPAAGARDEAVVPAGTQIATAPPAEAATFETEKTLTVMRSRLAHLFSHDPAGDLYTDQATVVDANGKIESMPFLPFSGRSLIPHQLHLSNDILFNINHPTKLTFIFTLGGSAARFRDLFQRRLSWKIRSQGERDVTPAAAHIIPAASTITVVLEEGLVSAIDETEEDGVNKKWVTVEAKTALSAADASLAIQSLQVMTQAVNIRPARAFFNAMPLDTNREFHPFGERPKIYDTFFLAVPEAFSRQNAVISIITDFDPGKTAAGVALHWEFWDGTAWSLLGTSGSQGLSNGIIDTTKAFTEYGVVLNDSSGKPALRIVATAPDVTAAIGPLTGVDKFNMTVVCGSMTEPFNDLTMASVEQKVNGVSKFAKVSNLGSPSADSRPQAAAGIAVPLPRIEFTCPGMQMAEVNGKQDYWIRTRITSGNYGEDAKMEVVNTALDPTLDNIKYVKPSFSPPVITGLTVSYEYQTGQAMTAIKTENNFSFATIDPRTRFSPFARSKEDGPACYLGFGDPLPAKAASIYVAVRETAYQAAPLVRWEYWNGSAWENLGVQDGTRNCTESGMVEFIAPGDLAKQTLFRNEGWWIRMWLEQGDATACVLGVYPNTTWARQAVTIADELLGSSTETPNAEFRLSRTPVLEGLQLEIREPEMPGNDELEILVNEEGTDVVRPAEAGEASREQWVRWHRVEHFRLSGKKSRHYTLDWDKGTVRFGDGQRGMVPPAGRGNIVARRYQSGGGSRANVRSRTVSVLKRAIPFVDGVVNVDAAGGGSDGDVLEDIRIRGPQAIKHRDRAVTLEDYEWLAKEASLQVARAKCLPARTKDDAGTVGLIIVPHSDDLRPFPSQGLITQVDDHISSRARRIGTAELSITGPKYAEVSVQATVFPENPEEADLIRRRVSDRLTAFFHPLTGGPERTGWEFGRDVYVSEVCKEIEDTEGVHHAEDVMLGPSNADRIDVPEDSLVASGEHTVTMRLAVDTGGGVATTAALTYLGNMNSHELHDPGRITPQCRIERILPVHRALFSTVEEAKRKGYDLCAWCFGRKASTR